MIDKTALNNAYKKIERGRRIALAIFVGFVTSSVIFLSIDIYNQINNRPEKESVHNVIPAEDTSLDNVYYNFYEAAMFCDGRANLVFYYKIDQDQNYDVITWCKDYSHVDLEGWEQLK